MGHYQVEIKLSNKNKLKIYLKLSSKLEIEYKSDNLWIQFLLS
jgi:hypothetical protein